MKAHFMRLAPQDWHSSPLRGELAVERDHLARMVYLELLLKLHEAGGKIRREQIPGALLITNKEAERAIERLLRSGRIVDDDGWIANPRVVRDLQRDKDYRAQQAQFAKQKGGSKPPGGNPQGSLDEPLPPYPYPYPVPKPDPSQERRDGPARSLDPAMRTQYEIDVLRLVRELSALTGEDTDEILAEGKRTEGDRKTGSLNPASWTDERLRNTRLDLMATLKAEQAKRPKAPA